MFPSLTVQGCFQELLVIKNWNIFYNNKTYFSHGHLANKINENIAIGHPRTINRFDNQKRYPCKNHSLSNMDFVDCNANIKQGLREGMLFLVVSIADTKLQKYEIVPSQLTQHSGMVFMICILWQGSFLMLSKNSFKHSLSFDAWLLQQ